MGYCITLAPGIHPHPSRQASEALALTCQGFRGASASAPPPGHPSSETPAGPGGFGKGPPGRPLTPGDPRPTLGLLRLRPAQCQPLPGRRGDTAPGRSRSAGSGGLCPAPALASLAASRQAPSAGNPPGTSSRTCRRGAVWEAGSTPAAGARPGNGHPGRAVGPSVAPTLRTRVPKLLSRGIPALLQPCPQDPNPGASRAELRPALGAGGCLAPSLTSLVYYVAASASWSSRPAL